MPNPRENAPLLMVSFAGKDSTQMCCYCFINISISMPTSIF